MDIIEISKRFPSEEKYSDWPKYVDPADPSVWTLAKVTGKVRYVAHFISKISDADTENPETQIWFEFALACGYLNWAMHEELQVMAAEVERLIGFMLPNPEKFGASEK